MRECDVIGHVRREVMSAWRRRQEDEERQWHIVQTYRN